jgi:hypothetical protein
MSRTTKNITEEEKKEAKKLARKKYVLKNKTKVAKQIKDWKENNKEKVSEFYKNYELTDSQKKAKNQYKKIWYEANKEKAINYYSEYRRNRKLIDEIFKLKGNIRSLVSNAFKKYKFRKSSKTADILGCSYEEFKQHIESKFEPWMNWGNHGKYNGELNFGWDIDHIIPLSSVITESDVIQLNHYTNLQPLCSKVNRDVKRNKNRIINGLLIWDTI